MASLITLKVVVLFAEVSHLPFSKIILCALLINNLIHTAATVNIMWTFLCLTENNNTQKKKTQSADTTVMIIRLTEQNAIFQPTAFVWEVSEMIIICAIIWIIKNIHFQKENISPRPTFPVIILLCIHTRGEMESTFHLSAPISMLFLEAMVQRLTRP